MFSLFWGILESNMQKSDKSGTTPATQAQQRPAVAPRGPENGAMSGQEGLLAGYITAVYFTDTGDNGQPSANDSLTPGFKAVAWADCRNFWNAYRDEITAAEVSPAQAGHDLWLTRNGHGAGFWDRPELYGKPLAEELSRVSRAVGSRDSEFVEEPAPLGIATTQCKVGNRSYQAELDTDGCCSGCAADTHADNDEIEAFNGGLCNALPNCSVPRSIIWVEVRP